MKILRPFFRPGCPQPVDEVCVQGCGTGRCVTAKATLRNRASSTAPVDIPWISGGYPGGQRWGLSYVRPSVDKHGRLSTCHPQFIHGVEAGLAWANSGYPQFPHHRWLRRVISLIENKTIFGLWIWAQHSWSQPPGPVQIGKQYRIGNLPAGGIA